MGDPVSSTGQPMTVTVFNKEGKIDKLIWYDAKKNTVKMNKKDFDDKNIGDWNIVVNAVSVDKNGYEHAFSRTFIIKIREAEKKVVKKEKKPSKKE